MRTVNRWTICEVVESPEKGHHALEAQVRNILWMEEEEKWLVRISGWERFWKGSGQ